MLTTFAIDHGRLVKTSRKDAAIFLHTGITREESLPVAMEYGLSPHTLRSAIDPEELARVEISDNYTAIICKRPHQTSLVAASDATCSFCVTSLGMFLFKDRLVIVFDEGIAQEDFQQVHKDIGNFHDIVLNLIQHSVMHFYEQFRLLQNQVHQLEQKLITSTGDKQLMALFLLEKNMTVYLNSLGSNNILLEQLQHLGKTIGFSPAQIKQINNIKIDTHQCYSQAEVSSQIMANLTDTTASLVNNKLSLLMKHLTIISLIFLPINAIAGIGGMSEFSEAARGWGFSMGAAYGLLTLSMGAIAYLTYVLIRRIGD